jgi:GPH family glycoside/pentoside/hexuronide:cation symporter
MGILSLIAILLFFVTFFTTKERVYPPKEQKSDFKKDLKDLFTNKPWLLIAGATVFQLTYIVMRNGSIAYYFKYYVMEQQLNLFGYTFDLSTAIFTSSFMLIGTISTIIGAMLTKWFSSKFDKKNTYSIFLILSAGLCAIYYYIPPESVILIYLFNIILSFFLGPVSVLQWAMYTDTADYSEWKNNRRATGLIMSASLFALKLGFEANQAQAAEAINGIKLLMSYFPAIIGIMGGILIIWYPLNNQKMIEIEKDLSKRRID